MAKKTVLVYGDSNTWGWAGYADISGDNDEIRVDGGRFDEHTRYPMALQDLLGDEFYVVEEGCSGRTTVYDSDVDDFCNGKKYLYPCLHSHMPLEYVVIMLGSNDISNGCHMNAYYAAAGCERLVNLVRDYCHDIGYEIPTIIVVAPPLIESPRYHVFEEVFNYPVAIEESKKFRRYYKEISDKRNCVFVAAEDYVHAGPDGIHMTADSHLKLAKGLYDTIMSLENK